MIYCEKLVAVNSSYTPGVYNQTVIYASKCGFRNETFFAQAEDLQPPST